MTLQELINRTRVYTRDFTGSIFREADIDIFLREAFNRVKIIPELKSLIYPATKLVEISVMPATHQYIFSLYASSRCFFQDEQDYRAGTLMNEFEVKLEELTSLIQSGQILVTGTDGLSVEVSSFNDSVVDEYFDKRYSDDENNQDTYLIAASVLIMDILQRLGR